MTEWPRREACAIGIAEGKGREEWDTPRDIEVIGRVRASRGDCEEVAVRVCADENDPS